MSKTKRNITISSFRRQTVKKHSGNNIILKKKKHTNKHLKKKPKYLLNNDKHTQKGGFISYFKNLYQMYKFNKLVKEMNKAETKMNKDFENYINQTKIIKDMTNKFSIASTNYIINYRKQSILKVLKKDRNVYRTNERTIERNIEQSEYKDIAIEKTIEQLDKEIKKDMPNFNKLTKLFTKNALKFNEIVKRFSEMSNYRTKINVKQARHAILVEDKKKVNKKYKSDIEEYEKNKGEFEKFINFDDTYVENLNKKVQEIDDQLKLSQFYIDQFGVMSKDKSSATKELKKWKVCYEKIYSEIAKTLDVTKVLIKYMDELRQMVDSIRFASSAIYEDYLKKRNIEAINTFIKDIDDMNGIISVIGKDITNLRLEFIKETPASMISMDYNIGEVGTNYIFEKLTTYSTVFENAIAKANQIKGGYRNNNNNKNNNNNNKLYIGGAVANPNELSILTYNIYQNICGIDKYTPSNNPELIFTQETNSGTTNSLIANYNFFETNNLQNATEEVGVFYSNKINKSDIKFLKHIQTTSLPTGCVIRNAVIIEYKGIKIANLHLEGGRNVDTQLKDGDFITYLNYKLELLTQVINENPDIILGDFNSVYSSDSAQLQIFLNDQKTYYNTLSVAPFKLNDVNIKKWNTEPYELLTKKGYKYLKPQNEKSSITSGMGKSIVDCIWFRDNNLQKPEGKIEDVMRLGVNNFVSSSCTDKKSDHNPVFAKFTIKNPSITNPAATNPLNPSNPSNPLIKISDPLLVNIIAAVNDPNIKGKYVDQYNTILNQAIAIKGHFNKILDKDGELKKLSNSIQAVTQSLIELKYIEPKLISINVKGEPPLFGQYSWILESAKNVGKEYPVLSGAVSFLESIKKNQLRRIDEEGGLSNDKLKDAAIAIISEPKKLYTDPNIENLFRKITSNDKLMSDFLDIIYTNLPPSSSGNPKDNKKACEIFNNIASFIGRGQDKIKMIANIDSVANKYPIGNNQYCKPSLGQTYQEPKDKGQNPQQQKPYQQPPQYKPY